MKTVIQIIIYCTYWMEKKPKIKLLCTNSSLYATANFIKFEYI